MVRLFATDLDGTFLADHWEISDTNSRALTVAQEAGVPIVFATGRAAFWVEFLRPYAESQPLAIVSNGAAVLDMQRWEYLKTFTIDHQLAHDVMADLRAAFPTAVFSAEVGMQLVSEAGYRAVIERPQIPGRIEDTFGDGPVLIIVAQQPHLRTEEFHAAALPVVADRLTGTFSFVSEHGVLELSSPGVSKAYALAWLCAERGIDAADVACFGDMPNDVEMLRWCGHPHVMPQSHPLLLATGFPVLAEPSREAVGTRIMELIDSQ